MKQRSVVKQSETQPQLKLCIDCTHYMPRQLPHYSLVTRMRTTHFCKINVPHFGGRSIQECYLARDNKHGHCGEVANNWKAKP